MLTKKNVLWVVLSMLVVTAAVGIWAVFSDHIDKTQEKILLTTGVISAACILMLPCLAHTERKYLRHAAWAGHVPAMWQRVRSTDGRHAVQRLLDSVRSEILIFSNRNQNTGRSPVHLKPQREELGEQTCPQLTSRVFGTPPAGRSRTAGLKTRRHTTPA
jgi:hypothetical protein